ncbi:MAG: hypothetical protein ACLP5H_19255 [Desulfomonilaceae bacterium]
MAERGKLILMKTKKPPSWDQWNERKSVAKTDKTRITMTQTEVLSIFHDVVRATSQEDAYNLLESRMPTRKHLSYWLGQIGHRQDVRLSNRRDFRGYAATIVERLRARTQDNMTFLQDEEGKKMKKKNERPVVVIRNGKSSHKADEPSETMEEMGGQVVSNNESGLTPTVLHENSQPEEAMKSTDAPPKEKPATSRLQDNFLKSLLVFADCVVQTNAAGVFDTLARNFADKAILNYWLFRVGYGHLSSYTRNKDVVDAIRKVAHELHRDMKKSIGKAVARW